MAKVIDALEGIRNIRSNFDCRTNMVRQSWWATGRFGDVDTDADGVIGRRPISRSERGGLHRFWVDLKLGIHTNANSDRDANADPDSNDRERGWRCCFRSHGMNGQ
jgi:hypothetical protein